MQKSNPPRPTHAVRWGVLGGLRLGQLHCWLLAASCLDLFFTMLVLMAGGREANPIANHILAVGGGMGLVVLKFSCYLLVVVSCEYIGQHRLELAENLEKCLIGLWFFPAVFGAAQLVLAAWTGR